jgi:ribosome-associated protein
MEDTLQADRKTPDSEETATALGELLREHNGGDVAVMDLRELNIWTDFFVIATVTSNAHVQGLIRHIKDFTRDRDIEILHRRRKTLSEDEWNLVDLGTVVVHLMSEKARSFYELERLWALG